MESKSVSTLEQFEQIYLQWERGLYVCYGVVVTMLIHAMLKAYENTMLANAMVFIQENTTATNLSGPSPYDYWMYPLIMSQQRVLFVLIVELIILACGVTLAVHPKWRQTPMPAKQLDLVFGYLLAGWIELLVFGFGVMTPFDQGIGYGLFIVGYIFVLIVGYWWLRHKNNRSVEIFP